MYDRTPPGMVEVTRLTRLGKVAEATALIQRMLRGEHFAGTAAGAPAVIDAEYTVADAGHSSCDPAPRKEQSRINAEARSARRPHTSLREAIARSTVLSKLFREGLAPAPLLEPLPEGASFSTAAYANAEGSREYKLYSPSRPGSGQRPLIVMLHGCTQTPDDFAAGTRMNKLAEQYGFFVVYPAQHSEANAKRCWNWFQPQDQRRDQGEPSLIAGITREVMDRHLVDPERIYIAGLSAGGAAAAIMADTYPELYAAAGVHSGLPAGAANGLPSAFDAMRTGAKTTNGFGRPFPAIIFHGENDPIVNPSNGEALVKQALGQTGGLRQTIEHGRAPGGHAFVRKTYDDHKGQTVCEHWSIREGGHAWAGGSESGSHTDPQGPDASKEMVRFFLNIGVAADPTFGRQGS